MTTINANKITVAPAHHEIVPSNILQVAPGKLKSKTIEVEKKRTAPPDTRVAHSPAEYLLELQKSNPHNQLIQNFKFTNLSDNPVEARKQMIQQLAGHNLWEQTHNNTGATAQRNLLDLPHADHYNNHNIPQGVTETNVNWPQIYVGKDAFTPQSLKKAWSEGLPAQEKLDELHKQAISLGVQIEKGKGLTAAGFENKAGEIRRNLSTAQTLAYDELKAYFEQNPEQYQNLSQHYTNANDGWKLPNDAESLHQDWLNRGVDFQETIDKLTQNNHKELASKLENYYKAKQNTESFNKDSKQLYIDLTQHESQLELLEHERQLAIMHGHQKGAERLAFINQEIQTLENSIKEAQANNTETTTQEAQLTNLKEEQAELTQELMPFALQCADEHKNSLSQQISNDQTEISNLKKKFQESDKRNDELEGKRLLWENDITNLNRALDAANAKIEEQKKGTSGDLFQQLRNVQWNCTSAAIATVVGLLSVTGLLSLFNSLFGTKTTETVQVTQYKKS